MSFPVKISFIAVIIFSLTACGQSGPLYLPPPKEKGASSQAEQTHDETPSENDGWADDVSQNPGGE